MALGSFCKCEPFAFTEDTDGVSMMSGAHLSISSSSQTTSRPAASSSASPSIPLSGRVRAAAASTGSLAETAAKSLPGKWCQKQTHHMPDAGLTDRAQVSFEIRRLELNDPV